ncbi:MAG: transposase [Patescibacteria group bacterium]
MSRPIRLDYPGALHHVTSRGNARQVIFRNPDERELFYGILASVVGDFNWICHADCQMGNHYHLDVETPEANLSAGMRQLNGEFTQKVNRLRGTVGHLLQGRFLSKVVDSQNYLLAVCRYIVLNPVRAKMVAAPDGWAWSSYRATVGLERPRPHLTTDGVLSNFGETVAAARSEYSRFVWAGIGAGSPFDGCEGPILGGEDFVRRVMEADGSDRRSIREVPRRERLAGRPSLPEIRLAAGDGAEASNQAMLKAWADCGYSQTEISAEFGLHYASVSRILKGCRKRC